MNIYTTGRTGDVIIARLGRVLEIEMEWSDVDVNVSIWFWD